MPNCCYADEYGRMFSGRAARRTARTFRRKGLRGSAKRLADRVVATGVDGATVLEVGGGSGEIHVDLLRRGAAGATNIELSPSWEAAASELLAACGLEGRVQRRVGDFVDLAGDLPEADVVVLHRVICCYPDWQAMLSAAIAGARRVVAITVPVDRWTTRALIRAGNAALRLQKRSFRAFVHPPDRMVAALRSDGFELVGDHHGIFWRTFVAVIGPQERRAAAA